MGRPTKFNRDDAIELAMNTFWEKGFAPTSVSDLASAMSITRSSFYNSFESREAIFDEALARYEDKSTSLDITPEFEGFCPVRATRAFFYEVCQNLANDMGAKGCLVINCYVQSGPDAPVPAGVQAFIDTKHEQFERVAQIAQARGAISKTKNPATIADALVALLVGVNVMGKDIRDADRLWSSADMVLTSLGLVDQ